MRGKALVQLRHYAHAGITPAHAGKSAPAFRPIAWTGDHPRPCGEKLGDRVVRRGWRGSPPPMRGKG